MVTASFKLTEDQMRRLRDNAHAKRMSLSDYVRTTLLPPAKKKKCRVTGRPGRVIIKHPPDTAPITDADLDAAEEEYYNAQ